MNSDATWAESERSDADLGDVRQVTIVRTQTVQLVLAIQETWSTYPEMIGLEPLVALLNQDLLAHITLARD